MKKLGPVGCALFLLLSVAIVVTCLTTGRDPIPGYSAPQDTAYYASHPEELCRELEANVFPQLEGVENCSARDDHVEITIRQDSFAVTRAAILRYFDDSLFVFLKGD